MTLPLPVGDTKNDALSGETDAVLLSRTAQRDEAAFRLLARRYIRMIHAVSFRMGFDPTDAEDITQEVLFRVWEKAGTWKAEKAAVSTWIYRITVNLCIDRRRRIAKARETELSPAWEDEGTKTPEALSSGEQTAQKVRQAISALPHRQKAALILCHYEGQSNAEAAEILGTSLKSVETLLVRARRTLRQKLQREKEKLR